MKRKPEQIEPTPPEQLEQREQELFERGRHPKDPPSGWQRRGNPTWIFEGGRSVATKAKPTTSAQQLRMQNAVAMANLARSAMAKYGYDGTGMGGAEGYMTMLAQRFPLQFMTDIIAKMISPDTSFTGQVDINLKYESSADARKDIGNLAVPLDLLLERDDPPLLEQLPARESGNGKG